MRLQDLAAGLPAVGMGSGWPNTVVTGLALDSRRVSPGDMFCAVPGSRRHGVEFWNDAKSRGAAALLTDVAPDDWPPGAVGLRTPAVRRVLAEVAARLHGQPARNLRIVGVTGTNGKTTTVHMVTEILRQAGWPTARWSTTWVDWPEDGGGFRPTMTTPDPPDLHAFLAAAVRAHATDAVMEVSSHAVVLERVRGVQFAVGVATNLTPDHLDFHKTFEAYAAAKRQFIASLPSGATAVLNADDPVVSDFARACRARPLRYGLRNPADARAADIRLSPTHVRFRLVLRGSAVRRPAVVPVTGRHNVANALAAILATQALGVHPDTAVRALARFQPPVRRLEPIPVGPYTVVNDVAMNRASYDTVMEAMAALRRPLVVVNAVRGNRGEAVNRDAARVLGRWNTRLAFAPLILTTSDAELARMPVDYRVRAQELSVFQEEARAAGLALSLHRSLHSAIVEAVDRLVPGGLLLLLGTFGMDDGPRLAAEIIADRLGTPAPDLPRSDERAPETVAPVIR
jgi:UDP-N-acetylmuramoyl-L-alanyl-D-glutamate--2,6-diaminopimelate ligase